MLILDARQVYHKVTRTIYDFSPEQMQNLSAIVWLYRGRQPRFLALIRDYLGAVCTESTAIPAKLAACEKTLADLRSRFSGLVQGVDQDSTLNADKKKALIEATAELADAEKPYETDRARLLADLDSFRMQHTAVIAPPPGEEPGLWETNQALHAARRKFDPIAEAVRGLIKQVDLLYKLTARVADLGSELAVVESVTDVYDRRAAGRLVRQLDEERKAAVDQLKHVVYFHRQVVWLQERFPKAELEAVPGLVKLVDKQEVEAADWSLTPGRYVGVAPSGWEKTNASQAMSVLSGGTPKTSVPDFWDGDTLFYTPKDASDHCYVLETERSITELGLNNCNSRLYHRDTIFISARGTVGKLLLACQPMAMSQSCYALVGKGHVSQFFLYCALQESIEHLKQHAVGAVFDAIVVDTFKRIPFLLPDAKSVRLFEETVAPMFKQVGNLMQQNQKLRAARDLLLPRLMSGEIAV